MTNSKRARIFRRLDEGASPTTIKREFDDRLEACSWLYILKLTRERATAHKCPKYDRCPICGVGPCEACAKREANASQNMGG